MNKRIQVRMRAIPARFVIEPPEQKARKKRNLLELLRDWLGVITAATGVFSVLLYLAGRNFASGYFSAMNIPNFQVSFSLWEYGEVGWIPLVLYPVGMFALGGLFWGVCYTLRDWTNPIIRRIGKSIVQISIWFKNGIVNFATKTLKLKLPSIRGPKIKFPPISREARASFWLLKTFFNIFIALAFVVITLNFVSQWGESNGQIFVLQKSPAVELVSKNIIPLDDISTPVTQAGNNEIYTYKGFHLLTYNNGKYYLFKEVDKVTCKPSKVYIMDANEDIHVNLLPSVSLIDQCSKP